MGDPDPATKRLEVIRDFPQLVLNEVVGVSEWLLGKMGILIYSIFMKLITGY